MNEAFFVDGPMDGTVREVGRLDDDLYFETPEGLAWYERTLQRTYNFAGFVSYAGL